MIKLIVFDLDGTLLDTISGIESAVNRVLRNYGYQEHSQSFYKSVVGSGMKSLVHESFPKSSPHPIDGVVEEVKKEYLHTWKPGTTVYNGISEVLDWIQDSKIPMAILSNKPTEYVLEAVQAFLNNWTFYPIFGESEKFSKKPDPAGLKHIVYRHKLEIQNMLMVGDSAIDINTAHSLGCHSAGALWGFKSKYELSSAGANHLLEKPEDLIDLVNQL